MRDRARMVRPSGSSTQPPRKCTSIRSAAWVQVLPICYPVDGVLVATDAENVDVSLVLGAYRGLIYLPNKQVGQRGRIPAIGHVNHADVRHHLEQFAGDMGCGTGAR